MTAGAAGRAAAVKRRKASHLLKAGGKHKTEQRRCDCLDIVLLVSLTAIQPTCLPRAQGTTCKGPREQALSTRVQHAFTAIR